MRVPRPEGAETAGEAVRQRVQIPVKWPMSTSVIIRPFSLELLKHAGALYQVSSIIIASKLVGGKKY